MFYEDQRAIQEYALRGTEECERVVYFVSATIQQHFYTVPEIVRDFIVNGVDAKYAFRNKKNTIRWVQENAHDLWLYANLFEGREVNHALHYFTQIPGLGLVKAGFLAQLLTGKGGCIDIHNAKLYGVDLSQVNITGKEKLETKERKIDCYVKTCEDIGGSQYLWDEWCAFVASKYPTRFKDAEDVSKLHVSAITQEIP